jgi:hypothetical protein
MASHPTELEQAVSNPNGAKGASFERLIGNHFQENWVADSAEFIDRRVKTGAKDKGDLVNVRIGRHRLAVECKNSTEHRMNLSGWVKEAHDEAANDGAVVGLVVHKRKGIGAAGRQFVSMELDDLITLLHAAAGTREGI